MKRISIMVVAAGLAGCSLLTGNPTADAPTLFKMACSGISTANGAFNAVAPSLLVANKITQAEINTEATLFKVDQARCTNPPFVTAADGSQSVDYNALAVDIAADAGSVYLLLAGNFPTANKVMSIHRK